MPLAQCINPIFDSRNPQMCKHYDRGMKVELQPDEKWPGVKDLSKHFEFIDPEIHFPKVKKPEVKEKVEKPVPKAKRVFKCSVCSQEFNSGIKLGRHKKADHPQN
jgi:hypothetical protein